MGFRTCSWLNVRTVRVLSCGRSTASCIGNPMPSRQRLAWSCGLATKFSYTIVSCNSPSVFNAAGTIKHSNSITCRMEFRLADQPNISGLKLFRKMLMAVSRGSREILRKNVPEEPPQLPESNATPPAFYPMSMRGFRGAEWHLACIHFAESVR